MDDQTYSYYYQPKQPVESASGTTSPDNAKSGPTAYIVAAICILVLIGASMLTTRCVSKAINSVLPDVIDGTLNRIENEVLDPDVIEDITNRFNYETDIEGDSFEDYFERVFGEPYDDYFDNVFENNGERDKDRTDTDTETDSYEFDPHDVLGLDLAIYEWTIDGMVSANAYAGADGEVRDFVRDLVLADREANEGLIRMLRTATRDSENFEGRLDEAGGICQDMLLTLTDFDIPETDADTEGYLEEAIERTNARWNAILDLLSLVRDHSTVSDQDLEAIDDTIYYETRNAAQALENALSASKN